MRCHGCGIPTNHDLYQVFITMHARCTSPTNPKYPAYGARGIRVCKRWEKSPKGFANFVADVGPRPEGRFASGWSIYQLDRRNNDRGYMPSNVHWVPAAINNRNRRRPQRRPA